VEHDAHDEVGEGLDGDPRGGDDHHLHVVGNHEGNEHEQRLQDEIHEEKEPENQIELQLLSRSLLLIVAPHRDEEVHGHGEAQHRQEHPGDRVIHVCHLLHGVEEDGPEKEEDEPDKVRAQEDEHALSVLKLRRGNLHIRRCGIVHSWA
jgi:hypothetical protein